MIAVKQIDGIELRDTTDRAQTPTKRERWI